MGVALSTWRNWKKR